MSYAMICRIIPSKMASTSLATTTAGPSRRSQATGRSVLLTTAATPSRLRRSSCKVQENNNKKKQKKGAPHHLFCFCSIKKIERAALPIGLHSIQSTSSQNVFTRHQAGDHDARGAGTDSADQGPPRNPLRPARCGQRTCCSRSTEEAGRGRCCPCQGR